ncbi:MAG: hypothetical protein P4L72_11690 [Parvibaculum sp.]|jgi:hypothetical protein|uniref:hypothetical protein n=1 Tax=Parvibaculum sp. TaxID=2024848 RepID=UPI00284D2E71|nr:hypothetical protein [Parvibaculum sp.]MDR3499874.1 hypothetical protein [Parvibaculum sp.]
MALLPASSNDQYEGAAASAWFLVLASVLTIVPGCIHYFLPDGGAGVIAHLDFGDRANTIIAIFAWYGAMQIPFGIAQLLVGLRYRALVPLFLLLMLIQQALSAYSAWFGKGSHGDHHPPEHYGSVVFVGLGLVFLALSLRRKHSKVQA